MEIMTDLWYSVLCGSICFAMRHMASIEYEVRDESKLRQIVETAD